MEFELGSSVGTVLVRQRMVSLRVTIDAMFVSGNKLS